MQNDLEYFAEHALQIRPKDGKPRPFVFNAAQRKLHELLEKQKRETGRVRALVLKAKRQLGISTYLAARNFQRTIFSPGILTIIIGHERRASTNLFEMVQRFLNLPADLKLYNCEVEC